MTKTVETLVEDIYDIFRGPHEIAEENLERFAAGVKEAVKSSLEEAGTKDTKALRMSVVGLPDRKLWYMVNDSTPQTLEPKDYIKFLFGHMLEHLLLFLTREAGHKVENEQLSIEVGGIPGTMDCEIDDVPVDCKSCSSHAIKKFRNDTLALDDPFGYIGQISGYAQAMGKDEAGFLAINKEAGEIVYLPVDSMDLIDVEERSKHLDKVLADPTPPERCYSDQEEGKSGNRILSKNCAWCFAKNKCWSDANGGEGLRVFQYSNGLKYFTEVSKEPRVEEVL